VTSDYFPPNLDRISILSATILLAYTLTGLISIPPQDISTQLPGFYLEIQINFETIVSFLVAVLAATGTDWFLREHPKSQDKRLIEHWLLPALMAWVIGVPLYQQDLGLYWWLGILLGGGALVLVLVAEFIVINPEDARYAWGSVGLTVIAHVLFFLLVVTLRASQIRLFLLIPALTLTIGLISLRTLNLRLRGKWNFRSAAVITLIMVELSVAAHYLPLSPVAFGLFLLGPAYGLTNLFGNLGVDKTWKEASVDPLIILIVFWGLAFWLR
jgi:hypothetical protein